jgi:hypothetical protein
MESSGDKLKKSERLRRLLDFIFGFKNRRGEVLEQWIYSAEAFSLSPGEFYTVVEKQLESTKTPGVEIRRERFAEGGLLSDQRIYLRFMRERLAIDTCAAPFGKTYFFSCRTLYIPALVRLWHIVAALAFLFVVTVLLVKPLGFSFAIIAVVALMFAIVGVMRNAGTGAFDDIDKLLLKTPVMATIYEDWFRVETYYREDTRTLYLKLLPALIQSIAEEFCAEKGVKLVRQHQFPPPVLHELFQPLPPHTKKTK